MTFKSSTELPPLPFCSSSDDDDDVDYACVVGATDLAMPATGTISLAYLVKDGIVLASYSRVSMMKSDTSRIMGINPYTLCTMVGEPVDQLFWTQCELFKRQNGTVLPIDIASKLLKDMMKYYARSGVSAEALIAGWEGESPILYYVDKDCMGCVSGPRFGVGYGKTCLNHALKVGYNYDMSICEAVSFAQRAIDLAVGDRVASSVYYVGPHGWKKILGDDVKFPAFSGPMNIEYQKIFEDQETPVMNWQARLKDIEKLESKIRMAEVHGSDFHGFQPTEERNRMR